MKRRCCLPDEVGQRLLHASAVSDNQSNQSCLPATSKHESSLFLSLSLSPSLSLSLSPSLTLSLSLSLPLSLPFFSPSPCVFRTAHTLMLSWPSKVILFPV